MFVSRMSIGLNTSDAGGSSTPGTPDSGGADSIVHKHLWAGSGIFLQTKLAQCVAGIAVWLALFLTCQQVLLTISLSLFI